MRKKIKLIFLSIGLSIALIAGIIELGKILNVVSTQETSQGFKETLVKAAVAEPKTGHIEGSLDGAPCGQMYNFAPGYYCARHEWEIARHLSHDASTTIISDPVGSGRAQKIEYTYNKTTEMTQSIAYAQNYELGGKTDDWTMQRLVWGSWQFKAYTGNDCGLLEEVKEDGTWTTASNGMIGRSYQFANFVYKALDDKGNLGLTFTPLADEDDSLKIMVDQTALKYTVGPYVLNFKNQEESCVEGTGDELMKDLVYNEIIEKNQGWTQENAFCTGKIEALITYDDNTHKLTETDIEILDASGNPIADKFPKFGETFYLRYKTTLNEDVRYIRPSIQINHLKKMTNKGKNYEVYTYSSKHITFRMITDQGGFIRWALREMTNTYGFREGFEIKAEAKVVGEHWIIQDRNHRNVNVMSYQEPKQDGEKEEEKPTLADRVNKVAGELITMIKNNIEERGENWGLGDTVVNIDWKGGIIWKGDFYELPEKIDGKPYEEINIISKCIYRKYSRQVPKVDPITHKTYYVTEYTDRNADSNGNLPNGPSGDGWSVCEEKYKAWISNPLNEEMANVVKEGATEKEAQQAVQNWLDDPNNGGIGIGFKITNIIVDQDILKSQPNLELNEVHPPEKWQDKEITVKEILDFWHIQDGKGYDYDLVTKEKLAGSLIEEENDYAVERATLPRKRNKYVFRTEKFGKICRRQSLESLLV